MVWWRIILTLQEDFLSIDFTKIITFTNTIKDVDNREIDHNTEISKLEEIQRKLYIDAQGRENTQGLIDKELLLD